MHRSGTKRTVPRENRQLVKELTVNSKKKGTKLLKKNGENDDNIEEPTKEESDIKVVHIKDEVIEMKDNVGFIYDFEYQFLCKSGLGILSSNQGKKTHLFIDYTLRINSHIYSLSYHHIKSSLIFQLYLVITQTISLKKLKERRKRNGKNSKKNMVTNHFNL